MSVYIKLDRVSVKFRIYHNPSPSLKDTAVNWVTGNKKLNDYRDFFALHEITLNINPGDRVGFVGLNGAGKSTLLKTISGIYKPHQGKISVVGRITPLMELGAGFDLEQTGRKNIFLNGALLGFSPAEMAEKEAKIAEFSELGDFLDLPVKYYSSGMYGRLAFSIATMTQPEILMIDEVFATGDGHFVEKSTQRIQQMVEKSSILIVVSHDSNQILRLCNRVILLDHGNIILDGDPQETIAQYKQKLASIR
ncbi:MAG TPA: ABC transporter ATP-binding protein [Anaerolineales bacterium]|nr:ABC transporter ATP-binding protein [Anaerolineales bacterium]